MMNSSLLFNRFGNFLDCSLGLRMELGFTRLVNEALKVPAWEYAVLAGIITMVVLYVMLDFHFVGDLITGLRGDKVKLVFSPVSKIAAEVVPKCAVLHRRYWPTVWLCSPHLQTGFVHFHGRPPHVEYRRQLFTAPDGGTIALDWLEPDAGAIGSKKLEEAPIVIVVPGLSSTSSNPYLKHLAHGTASQGWRTVIANHRGLGGVSITSDCYYNAGWTNDIRWIIADLHKQFPKALLLAVGASLGANMLVKYLGEEGENVVLGGAVSICCPWDLLVCDRFISRRPLQKLYDRAMAIGLTDYVLMHEKTLSTLSNWNLLKKSRSVRAFDNLFTKLVGKFETVDDYYRRCSSVYFLPSVAVPLLCVNSLDDPLCTKEAIPWDECRINPNVVLAVTQHGGHLAYLEGLTANNIWWVRAITQFFSALMSTSLLHVVHKESSSEPRPKPQVEPSRPLALVKSEEVMAEEMLPLVKAEEVANIAISEDTHVDSTQEELEEEAVAAQLPVTIGESSISASDKGLTIQLCLKTRAELLALQNVLSRILQESSNLASGPAAAGIEHKHAAKSSSSSLKAIQNKRALLLLAIPVIGSAVAIGLRRKGFNFKLFNSRRPRI